MRAYARTRVRERYVIDANRVGAASSETSSQWPGPRVAILYPVTRWHALFLAVALGCAALVGELGCAAPTLPIPPPTALVSPPAADGYVTVSGSANPDAYVFALNENTSAGVIGHAMPSGLYSLRVLAATGDSITVWQMLGNQSGQLVNVVVP